MKFAKIPKSVADEARNIMSHMLSCTSGQEYLVVRRITRTVSAIIIGMDSGAVFGRAGDCFEK